MFSLFGFTSSGISLGSRLPDPLGATIKKKIRLLGKRKGSCKELRVPHFCSKQNKTKKVVHDGWKVARRHSSLPAGMYTRLTVVILGWTASYQNSCSFGHPFFVSSTIPVEFSALINLSNRQVNDNMIRHTIPNNHFSFLQNISFVDDVPSSLSNMFVLAETFNELVGSTMHCLPSSHPSTTVQPSYSHTIQSSCCAAFNCSFSRSHLGKL